MVFTSTSIEQTQDIASHFAKELHGGDVIALVGDLGAGKTALVRALAIALGVHVKVKSPTFTILNEYPAQANSIDRIVHVDLYRFKSACELSGLALEEYLDGTTVICIEWPEAVGELPVRPTHTVQLEHVDEHTRRITIEPYEKI